MKCVTCESTLTPEEFVFCQKCKEREWERRREYFTDRKEFRTGGYVRDEK